MDMYIHSIANLCYGAMIWIQNTRYGVSPMNTYQTKRDECVIISYNDRQGFFFWCKDHKIIVKYEGDLDPWQPSHNHTKDRKLGTDPKEVWHGRWC